MEEHVYISGLVIKLAIFVKLSWRWMLKEMEVRKNFIFHANL